MLCSTSFILDVNMQVHHVRVFGCCAQHEQPSFASSIRWIHRQSHCKNFQCQFPMGLALVEYCFFGRSPEELLSETGFRESVRHPEGEGN